MSDWIFQAGFQPLMKWYNNLELGWECEGSGLSIREYCQAIGISVPSFSVYRKNEQGSCQTKKRGGFRKIQVLTNSETESRNLVIESPQGLLDQCDYHCAHSFHF